MPSMSFSRPMNRPNSVAFLTSPSTVVPIGWAATKASHGLAMACFRPRLTRRLDGSTSSTTTSTSCEVETILPGWTFFLVQDISETWTRPSTPGFQLHEGAVVGDVGDAAGELRAHRVLGFHAVPGVGLELLHAERDALGVRVDLDDLHLHRVADRQDLARVVDALPAHVGDMQQAVDAAQVHERAVVGDVLDHAFADFAFLAAGRPARCAVRRGLLPGWRGARRRCCRADGPS